MKRYKVGPCIVCGGKPLRDGKRRHKPEVHERMRVERKKTCNLKRRTWPRLQGRDSLLKYCAKQIIRPSRQEWECKVLRSGEVLHVPVQPTEEEETP